MGELNASGIGLRAIVGFLSIFAKASRAGAPSYSEESLKQKIEIMGELNASGIGLRAIQLSVF